MTVAPTAPNALSGARSQVPYIARLAGVGFAGVLICAFMFCPAFTWWGGLRLHDPAFDKASEINRAREVLKQLDDPWVKITDPIAPESDKVEPLIDQAAKAYAEKNAGWPARTEACDSKS